MKKIKSNVFQKPECSICRFFIRQERKNGKIPYCKIYKKDVPDGGTIHPIWCHDKYEQLVGF